MFNVCSFYIFGLEPTRVFLCVLNFFLIKAIIIIVITIIIMAINLHIIITFNHRVLQQ